MPIALSIILLTPPGPAIFDQSLAAFRSRKAFSVSIALDATMNKNVTSERYSLSFQAPERVLLTKIIAGKPNLIFWMNGAKFVAYDPSSAEMAVRKAPTTGPIVNRLANAIGGLQDPVSAQLSPETMAAFLSPFRTLSGWQSSNSNGLIVLSRPGQVNGKKTMTQFAFSASTKLLTKALISGPTSQLQWVFKYGPTPKNLTFTPPPGTKVVTALAEHAHVNATDATARKVIDQSLRAYSRLTSLAFSVSGSTGASQDWMSKGAFREKQSGTDWAYRAGALTIQIARGKRTYRGRCKPSEVLSYLKVLRCPMDTVLQAFLLHRNPISGWFVPGMTISSHGTVKLHGISADAVELRSRLVEVSLLIRRDNHLVASVASKTKGENGRVISESHRDFSYSLVNSPPPASTFSIPAAGALPLSKLGK